MKTQIIFAGFGGQGIVAAGKTLIHAAMLDDKKVSLLPSYGPEMRGGFANCHIVVSDDMISSPIISKADAVVAMSAPAFEKFEDSVKEDGFLIYDSYLIKKEEKRKDIYYIGIPATEIALGIGESKFANVVLLGVLMGVMGIPSFESMAKAIDDMLPEGKKHLFSFEMQALNAGIGQIIRK